MVALAQDTGQGHLAYLERLPAHLREKYQTRDLCLREAEAGMGEDEGEEDKFLLFCIV